MARKAYGGHEHEFVGEVSDRLICQICTKILRDPHLAVCCGQHFCESCLNKWFDRQRGKQSCPHCRAEGDAFNHVVHKGLRSEVNQLKIRCTNRGEGCEWIGELGGLKRHLDSDNGCGFIEVECPNKCVDILYPWATTVKRKDLTKHLTQDCYLRPYQCEFCGLKDTYKAITGCPRSTLSETLLKFTGELYFGHEATCPEVPLTCPNKCGSACIKRKDVYDHRSKCPQEPVECPFAEAGCKCTILRCQLQDHLSTRQQQHLLMIMKDYKETKNELGKAKTKIAKLHETEANLRNTDSHHSQCPQEIVDCPFAEAGCTSDLVQCEIQDHLSSSLQQHLLMVMEGYKETKNKLGEAEAKICETEANLRKTDGELRKTKTDLYQTEEKLHRAEDKLYKADGKLHEAELALKEAVVRLSAAEDRIAWSNKLKANRDSVKIQMPNFSEYSRSGKVWHSPPFYYREGYKMCLAVYANGVGDGAGTHVSVSLLLLRGDRDGQLQWPLQCCNAHLHYSGIVPFEGHLYLIDGPHQRLEVNQDKKQLSHCDRLCSLDNRALNVVNDCLVFNVSLNNCFLRVCIV